ncbi:hypothetical protein LTR16_001803 [Cryomyces antarcticus]|uniref:Cytochrome P450 n=1 Tax=Cryomyces antarcticus TaxID=329879 RepID=A0ABR0KTN9_9PEZI|nr:hypothetical protein LTR39_001585 [Cryomyces antarcticus]KAK5019529.1 hypothetical protein LTR60_001090 [Cryomyces antarcticus]KAK5130031.1 hypothetical protein LTR16_001803 [Cryomyces antarcticus]
MHLHLSTIICAIIASIAWTIVYNVFLSPLSAIPGPLFAKITAKWLILVDLAGNRTSTIHRLHRTYGSVVRVGPTEVSFSDAEVIKELYSQNSAYMKAPVYDDFSLQPVGIFGMRKKEDHKQRRRLLSHAFAQSTLLETEPLIAGVVKLLLEHVESNVGQPLDVLALFRMLALDVVGELEHTRIASTAYPWCVGELLLGKSFGALASHEPPAYLEDLDRNFMVLGLKSSFPWVFKLTSYFPSKRWQSFLRAPYRLNDYGGHALKEYIVRYGRDPSRSKRKDLLTKMIVPPSALSDAALAKTPTDIVPLTDNDISMETANFVFAGTDTTSTTLTYLFWQLAQHSEWQDRLRVELASVQPVDGVAAFNDLAECRILDAVVSETLRLHPAAPASLQRETPAGGRELGGHFIPAGTVVSMQCYTTQRDPSVFPNPETFDPARWLGTPEKQLAAMNVLQMPFSRGTRACLGKNLALMELKLVTASVVKRYSVAVASSMEPGDMDLKDHFLAVPKSGRCELVFEKVVDA